MRVIAGIAKGRKLKTPKSRDIRPTSDRVREALFSILGDAIYKANVLDLFAGTGALGIEALSRGASEAMFVDEGHEAISLIKENVSTTGFSSAVRISKDSVDRAIERLSRQSVSFNLIFLDPPYRISVSETSNICAKVAAGLLEAGGFMVLEHSAKSPAPDVPDTEVVVVKRYGDTAITIYQKGETRDDSDMSR